MPSSTTDQKTASSARFADVGAHCGSFQIAKYTFCRPDHAMQPARPTDRPCRSCENLLCALHFVKSHRPPARPIDACRSKYSCLTYRFETEPARLGAASSNGYQPVSSTIIAGRLAILRTTGTDRKGKDNFPDNFDQFLQNTTAQLWIRFEHPVNLTVLSETSCPFRHNCLGA